MNAAQSRSLRLTRGYALLEVLVSLVIFSVGVLGVAAMQAVSLKGVGAAKYRTEASILADQLIGMMWADDRTPAVVEGGTSALQTNFQGDAGTGGPSYAAWLSSVNALLPGAASYPPTVVVTPMNASVPFEANKGKNRVNITVRWQLPGESEVHNYVAVTDIK